MDDAATIAIHHEYAEVNGVRLHYARAGKGPPLFLLHGFPQCWYEWRHQIPDLARDYEVIVPDMRGYNLSSKPDAVHSYGAWISARDIRALANDLEHDTFVLVGHDWGAATGWSFALHYPDSLSALVILSTAHPTLFDRELRKNPEQQQASQYLLLCRRPDAAKTLASDDYALLRAQLEFPFISESDLESFVTSWSEPGALEGMMRWFRREGLGPPDGLTPARGNYVPEVVPPIVKVPTLVFYGDADIYTRPGCHVGLEDYVPDLDFRNLDGVSHWIAEEAPGVINVGIREFIEAKVDSPTLSP